MILDASKVGFHRIAIALCLFSAVGAYANAGISAGVGVAMGASASSLLGGAEDLLGSDAYPSFAASVFADWNLTSPKPEVWRPTFLRTEVVYRRFGDTFTVVGENGEVVGRAWDYADVLSVPVLVRANLPLGWASLFATGGPRVDVFLNYAQVGWDNPLIDDQSFDRLWLGLAVGGGIDISVGSIHVIPEVRYDITLIPPWMKPRALLFLVGVRF